MKVIDNFNVVNQYVIEEGAFLYFQSYNSLIAKYNRASYELTLYQDFDYSSTTSKYLHKFLNDYVNCSIYDFIKKHDIRKTTNCFLQYNYISIFYHDNMEN